MRSPTPSFASTDSLCDVGTPEVLNSGALSSPSKSSLHSQKRHKVRISEDTTIMPSSIHEDDPELVLVVPKPVDQQLFSIPHRISLAGDPFFSSVRSSKTIISATQVQRPRPMYFRKSTFGHEKSPNRPEDYVYPLRYVSGNAQSPSKSTQIPETSDDMEHNPFRWSPQEAMKSRITPLSGRTSPNRKGHRRSNVVRMSNLPLLNPRVSTVEAVKEEPEEESPKSLSDSVCHQQPPYVSLSRKKSQSFFVYYI